MLSKESLKEGAAHAVAHSLGHGLATVLGVEWAGHPLGQAIELVGPLARPGADILALEAKKKGSQLANEARKRGGQLASEARKRGGRAATELQNALERKLDVLHSHRKTQGCPHVEVLKTPHFIRNREVRDRHFERFGGVAWMDVHTGHVLYHPQTDFRPSLGKPGPVHDGLVMRHSMLAELPRNRTTTICKLCRSGVPPRGGSRQTTLAEFPSEGGTGQTTLTDFPSE